MADVLEVRVSTEWHAHEFSWWMRIKSGSSVMGLIDEVIVRSDNLQIPDQALGTLEFSDAECQLWSCVPPQNVVDARMSEWVGTHGPGSAVFCNDLLKSLRRCCHYAALSCGAVRSGFDVNFVGISFSAILVEEITGRLEGLLPVVTKVQLIDIRDFFLLLLRCAIEAENRLLFEKLFAVITDLFTFDWLNERRKLFEILLAECPKMGEWWVYLSSASCCKFADRLDGANFEMVQQVLKADHQLQQTTKKRRL